MDRMVDHGRVALSILVGHFQPLLTHPPRCTQASFLVPSPDLMNSTHGVFPQPSKALKMTSGHLCGPLGPVGHGPCLILQCSNPWAQIPALPLRRSVNSGNLLKHFGS